MTAPVTTTDVLTDFTSYPTTAYPVTICTSTDLVESRDQPMRIHPNPTDGLVSIEHDGLQRVVVVDVTGRVLVDRSFAPVD